MSKYFLLAFLFLTAADGLKTERIAGGQDADIKEAPYTASILYGTSVFNPLIAGVIINDNVIMTVAFAISGTTVNYWRVRVGSTYNNRDGQLLTLSRYVTHPFFDRDTDDYDVCLLFLSSKIEMDGITMKAIPLPLQDATVPDFSLGIVTGWGSLGFDELEIYTDTLQKIFIPAINQQVCIDSFINTLITPRMICAGNLQTGGEGPCLRDYGSPYVINGVLIGIFSWSSSCGRPGMPNVFVRVSSIRNWIDQHVTVS